MFFLLQNNANTNSPSLSSSLSQGTFTLPSLQGPRMKETFALNGNFGNNRCDSFNLLEYLSDWFSNPGVYEDGKVCNQAT